jgi:hypothetical protein
MPGTESRERGGSTGGPPRFVARRGTSRRTPGCSQTTHRRPRRGVLVTAASGRVKP